MLGFGPGGYGACLLSGLLPTIELAALSYAASFVPGIGLAFVAVSSRTARRLVWRTSASAITGIPSLLVLFLIDYDLPPLIAEVTGVKLGLGP